MIAGTSVDQFLDELASAAPTPGGGSAAAVIGAMGAALISMVCNVTLGKKGQEAAANDMLAVRAESERLRARLTAMIAEDISVFNALMQAYRLPKASAEEKAQRAAAIQASLLGATETPLECARACTQLIGIARRAAEHGFAGVISDAGVGVLAAQTALRSAALNVNINTPSLENREYADKASAELKQLLEYGQHESEAVFTIVRARLG